MTAGLKLLRVLGLELIALCVRAAYPVSLGSAGVSPGTSMLPMYGRIQRLRSVWRALIRLERVNRKLDRHGLDHLPKLHVGLVGILAPDHTVLRTWQVLRLASYIQFKSRRISLAPAIPPMSARTRDGSISFRSQGGYAPHEARMAVRKQRIAVRLGCDRDRAPGKRIQNLTPASPNWSTARASHSDGAVNRSEQRMHGLLPQNLSQMQPLVTECHMHSHLADTTGQHLSENAVDIRSIQGQPSARSRRRLLHYLRQSPSLANAMNALSIIRFGCANDEPVPRNTPGLATQYATRASSRRS